MLNIFKEPQAYNFGKELIKIPGLDGTGKMGKSEGMPSILLMSQKLYKKK